MPVKLEKNPMQICEILRNVKILQMFYANIGVLLLFFILFCSLNIQQVSAQNEMQFCGCANLGIVVNPGAAGKTGSWNAVGSFRKQWVGFDGAPQTTILGIDGEVKFLKSFHGVGVSVFHDKVGPLTTMNINGNYSYHLELGKGYLGLGARLGVINVAFKTSDLKPSVDGGENDYHQSSDEALQGGDDSGTTFDVGLGGFYQSEVSYVSLSLLHLNAPTVEMKGGAEIKSRPVVTFGAGRKLGSSAMNLEPRIFFKSDFASSQLEMSALVNMKSKFAVGMGYRLQDAIFFEFGLNLSNGLYVGYTYDLCLSGLRRYNSGSHEVNVSYTFNIDVEKRTKRYKSVRIL